MNILTVNLCRLGVDYIDDVIVELSNLHRGIFFLQEVSAWPSGDAIIIHGWTLIHEQGFPAALLLPSKYRGDIRWAMVAGVHACAVLGTVGFISSYMPDV